MSAGACFSSAPNGNADAREADRSLNKDSVARCFRRWSNAGIWEAGATNLLLVTFLIPVSAVLLGALLLGERLAWTAFAGMAAMDGRVLTLVRPRGAVERAGVG